MVDASTSSGGLNRQRRYQFRAVNKATDTQLAAADKAAEINQETTREALDLTRGMFNRAVQMQYPWFQAGNVNALQPINSANALTPLWQFFNEGF